MTLWTSPPNPLHLQPQQVDIWRISLDVASNSIKQMESHLSTDELKRASRFHFEADRSRFIISHGSLRDILSRYLRCQPSELSFSTNDYGKPSLSRRTTKVVTTDNLEFNLSHSGNYALVAVAHECKVGIDVERVREDIEIEDLAARNFSPSEVSELMSLTSEQRTIGFFNCWTRKEAYIKAHGLGLSLPLDSFDVSLTPNEPAILRSTRPDPSEVTRWTLLSLDVDSDHAGALAVEGKDLEFRYWDWNKL